MLVPYNRVNDSVINQIDKVETMGSVNFLVLVVINTQFINQEEINSILRRVMNDIVLFA
jgi:hypothetical protein